MSKSSFKNIGGSIKKSLLYNRFLLYFIGIIALGYAIMLITLNDIFSLSIFLIIGFLTSFFSKNMVVILVLALTVSFIFKYGTNIRAEGFEEGETNTQESEKKEVVEPEKKKETPEPETNDVPESDK